MPYLNDPGYSDNASAGVIEQPQGMQLDKPKSIREYLDLMRSANQTPMFTNVQGYQEAGVVPMQEGMEGPPQFQPGAYMVGEPVVPGQPQAAQDAPKPYQKDIDNPLADPMLRAKAMLEDDMEDIWMEVTGLEPGQPAEEEAYNKFQAAVRERHELYLDWADKQAERLDGLLKNHTGESVFEALKSGDIRKLEKVKKEAVVNMSKMYQDQYNQAYERLSDPMMNDGEQTDPAMIREQAAQEAAQFVQKMIKHLNDLQIQPDKTEIPPAPPLEAVLQGESQQMGPAAGSGFEGPITEEKKLALAQELAQIRKQLEPQYGVQSAAMAQQIFMEKYPQLFQN